MTLVSDVPETSSHGTASYGPTGKRLDYITKDEFFMGMAVLAAMRSKDPRTQVGCCIASPAGIVVAIGYNGFPWSCSDDALSWAKEAADPLDTKFPYVCHAEMNAIMNAGRASVRGCTLFTTLFPCNECAKIIIQSGIAKVVYVSDKSRGKAGPEASRRMFALAGVSLRHWAHSGPIVLDMCPADGV